MSAEFPCCPFCGNAPRHLEYKAGFYSERVICDECKFHLPPEVWNSRSGITPPNTEGQAKLKESPLSDVRATVGEARKENE